MSDDYVRREDAYIAIHAQYPHLLDVGLHQVVNAIPTADVVKVVRCEDCKHAKRNDKHPDRPLICYLTRKVGEVKDGWFCADGERREE